MLETKFGWLKISFFYACKNIVFFWSVFSDGMTELSFVYSQNHNVISRLEVRQGLSLREAANTETVTHAAFEDDPVFSCTSFFPNRILCQCFNILWLCKKILIFIWDCSLRNIYLISNVSSCHRCNL